MYGYLRLLTNKTPVAVQSYYRGIYCSLCHALWSYYGLRPRFLLSYDMTFLGIVLKLSSKVNLKRSFLCIKSVEFDESGEQWKRLAAISILLAAKKFEDDIDDDNDFKAKVAFNIFRKASQKAENDYPFAAKLLQDGFLQMRNLEHQNSDVSTLADEFSKIIIDVVSFLFECTGEDKTLIRHVTRWIYFIDAIDDLDSDVKNDDFNPFKKYASSRYQLCKNHSLIVEDFISQQMKVLSPVLTSFVIDEDRCRVIMSILKDTIPTVTKRVLLGRKPYDRYPYLLRMLEQKGGYRLA